MSLASAPELTSAEDALSGDTAPSTDYVPLEVVGCIQERTPIEKTSAPQLKATSFPVARHRSERSVWNLTCGARVAVSLSGVVRSAWSFLWQGKF